MASVGVIEHETENQKEKLGNIVEERKVVEGGNRKMNECDGERRSNVFKKLPGV